MSERKRESFARARERENMRERKKRLIFLPPFLIFRLFVFFFRAPRHLLHRDRRKGAGMAFSFSFFASVNSDFLFFYSSLLIPPPLVSMPAACAALVTAAAAAQVFAPGPAPVVVCPPLRVPQDLVGGPHARKPGGGAGPARGVAQGVLVTMSVMGMALVTMMMASSRPLPAPLLLLLGRPPPPPSSPPHPPPSSSRLRRDATLSGCSLNAAERKASLTASGLGASAGERPRAR